MRLLWAPALLICACVRGGYSDPGAPDVATGDAPRAGGEHRSSEGQPAPDLGDPHTWVFKVAELGALNGTANDDDPTMTPDLLELVFDSDRSGKDQIWHATRSSPTAPWGAPALVASLNASSNGQPSLGPDGLTIYLNASADLWVSSRPSLTGEWAAPARVVELSSALDEGRASVTVDGLYMVLQRDDAAGIPKLFYATRPSPAALWGAAQRLAELTLDDRDVSPWIDAEGTMLLFASGRPGGAGSSDIWVATRARRADAFGPPRPLASVNSSVSDDDPWLSPDGRTLLFSRLVTTRKSLFVGTR